MTRGYHHRHRSITDGDISSTYRFDDACKAYFWVSYKLERKQFYKQYKQNPSSLINIRLIILSALDDIITNHQPIIITPYITNAHSFRSLFAILKKQSPYNKYQFSITTTQNDIIISLTEQRIKEKININLDYYYTNSITLTPSHLSTPSLLLSILRILITIPVRITFTGPKSDLELSLNHLLGFTEQSQSLRIISQPDNQSHDIRVLDKSILTDILSKID